MTNDPACRHGVSYREDCQDCRKLFRVGTPASIPAKVVRYSGEPFSYGNPWLTAPLIPAMKMLDDIETEIQCVTGISDAFLPRCSHSISLTKHCQKCSDAHITMVGRECRQ